MSLSSGRVVTGANTLNLSNSAPASLIGSSATAFIDGELQRAVTANIAADGTHYAYPVGTGLAYRPFMVRDVRTGALPLSVSVLATATGAISGNAPLVNMLSQNWQLTALAGNFNSATAELDGTGVNAGYVVGMANMQP